MRNGIEMQSVTSLEFVYVPMKNEEEFAEVVKGGKLNFV